MYVTLTCLGAHLGWSACLSGDPIEAKAAQDHHAGGGRARLRVLAQRSRGPPARREGDAALWAGQRPPGQGPEELQPRPLHPAVCRGPPEP